MTCLKMMTALACLVAVVTKATPAYADDTGLYGEAIPQDAAFVRWLDHDDPIARTAFAFDFSATPVPTDTYVAVSASLLRNADAGAYYSVLRGDDGTVHILEEPTRDDASKVHLFLLNAGPTPINLSVSQADTTVIGTTGTLEAQARAVNPISVNLAVQDSDSGRILDEFDVALRRGQNMTFARLGNQIVAIPSAFGPVFSAE